jgi:hypothetical protein
LLPINKKVKATGGDLPWRMMFIVVCAVFLRLSGVVVFADEIKGRCERYHRPDDGLCAASVTYPGERKHLFSVRPLFPPKKGGYVLCYSVTFLEDHLFFPS